MSEELKQKGLTKHGLIIGNLEVYNIGCTNLNQLKKYSIVPKIDYKKYGTRKPDMLVVDRSNKAKPNVIVVLEYKDTGKFKSDKDVLDTVRQCNDVAQEVDANIGIATDGRTFIWFNPKHKNKENEYNDKTTGKVRSFTMITKENGKSITEKFVIDQKKDEIDVNQLTDKTREAYLLSNNLSGILTDNNSVVVAPKTINPLPLAKNVWQDIWIATGKTPEKCLYNVVEIFIFKFLSDLEVVKEPDNFDFLFSLYEKGKSDKEVLDYYARICRNKIYELFPESAVDDTTLINGTIFVDDRGKANLSQAVLFKNSLHKFKSFEDEFGRLTNIDKDFKTKLYETFLKQTQGLKGLGQYFTPRKVVRAIVSMSGIQDMKQGQKVCDPFCGVGGFLLEPINLFDNLRNDFIPKRGRINPKIIYEGFDKGAEKDEERTIILAKANMLIYLSNILVKYSHLTKEFAKTFNKQFHLIKSNLGTLGNISEDENGMYDLILTNPPYVTKGKKTLSNEINNNSELKNFYSVNSIGVEGLALEWIIKHLKKGGSAFVVVPDGLLNRINDKRMRDFILEECYLNAIISLPKKTFFATSKKTYILSITKKAEITDEQNEPVFTYLVKDIGERLDVTRFEISENDLLETVSLYNQFKGSKNSFETECPKCKIQPIRRFNDEVSWIIDRWWSEEEKEKLGIVEPSEVLTLGEFKDRIKELGESLKEAIKEIKKVELDKKIKFLDIQVGDLFDLRVNTNNSKFTRSFVNEHKGDIPVYSASKDPDFIGYGKVVDNLKGVKYFQDCLTWNIDGFIGKAFYREGRFTLSEKVIPLVLRDEYVGRVDYNYVKYVLEKEAKKKELDFSNKAGKSRIADIIIKIPLKDSKKFEADLSRQNELAKKYRRVESIKDQIAEELRLFQEMSVEL